MLTLEDISEFLNIPLKSLEKMYENSEKLYSLEWNKYGNPNEFYSKSPAYLLYQFKMRKMTPSVTHSKIIIDVLRNKACRTVLDYGSGLGFLTIKLAERGFDTFYTDIKGIQIDFLRYILKKKRLSATYVPLNEIDKLKNFFDAVICLEVLEHSENLVETLDNITKLTKNLLVLSYTFVGRVPEPGHINRGIKFSRYVSRYLKAKGLKKIGPRIWNDRVKFYIKTGGESNES